MDPAPPAGAAFGAGAAAGAAFGAAAGLATGAAPAPFFFYCYIIYIAIHCDCIIFH